jgi:hypothetical protein
MTTIINSNNGTHIANAPLTTTVTREASPALLRNAIDSRIVKIRPSGSPIDQISRCAAARHSGSMIVDYYSVDTKPISATITEAVSGQILSHGQILTLKTDNNAIFSPSETVLLSIPGKVDLKLYISAVSDSAITAKLLNENLAEAIEGTRVKGLDLVRMGRAAAELDVQTAQFESLPVKSTNFCQIFKMQVEQSTFQKMADKEVGWEFSDQEEVAVLDMRMGMEKNFIFGAKARITDDDKRQEVYLTGGIWEQAANKFEYLSEDFTTATLIDMARQAFTGTNGSSRKVLVGGSAFIEKLSKLDVDITRQASSTFVKWGLEFNEIRTNFGSFYVIHSEVFDQCGHAADALAIDLAYLTKYCHVPFHTEKLDLRRSGLRNTDAIVITEASCLVLRHPKAHMRIVCCD